MKILNTQETKRKGFFPFAKAPFEDLKKDLKTEKKQLRISDDIPFIGTYKDDETLITKNASLIQIVKLKGISLISSRAEQENLLKEKKRILLGLDDRFSYSFLYFNRRNQEEFAQKPSVDLLTNKILLKWEEGFSNIFQTEIYLVVISKSPLQYSASVSRGAKENLITRYASISNHVVNLLEVFKKFKVTKCKGEDLLKVYDYVFNPYEEELRKHIFKYKQSASLATLYSRSDVKYCQNGLMSFESDLYKKYSKIVSIKSFPEETVMEIMDSLFKEKIEFLIVNNLLPNSEEKARDLIDDRLKQLSARPLVTDELENDALEARVALGEGKEGFYDFDFSIQVYADSEEDLANNIAKISGQLQRKGILSIVEKQGVRIKLMSFLPDTFHISPRKDLLSIGNISDMISLNSVSEGFNKCAFGDSPVVHMKTSKGSQYGFTFHVDEKSDSQGNTLVIGATGSGKSMITSFLLMNALNQFKDLQILGFDSKNGLKTPTSFFGGNHIRYGQEESLGFNPFQLEDTHENKLFLRDFIEILAGGVEEYEKDLVSDAIRNSFRAKKENRSLGAVMDANLFFEDIEGGRNRRPIHERLAQWVPDDMDGTNSKLHGMLFNAKKDILDFTNRWTVYDMEVALNSEVLYPMASYIFHKFRTQVEPKGVPHIVLIDEMSSYLNNPIFSKYILKHIKEARKKKGMFLGLLQSLSDILGNPEGKEIIQNTGTFILFPNDRTMAEDAKYLNLTDSEFEWLKNSGASRQVMIKKLSQETVIIDTDLMCLGGYGSAFSSDSDTLNKLEKLNFKENWRENLVEGSNVK